MRELVNDPFYAMIEKDYNRCVIDYCLMEDDAPDYGKSSHKAAVLFAMTKVIERYLEERSESSIRLGKEIGMFEFNFDIAKAEAVQIDPSLLLRVPVILPKKHHYDVQQYDCPWPDPDKGDQIPYWYAFLETPHTTGYAPEDFRKVNEVLFPEGPESLEVYEWTTDWSNYFDDGREWWGTACWSAYDRHLNRYVVIMASATD